MLRHAPIPHGHVGGHLREPFCALIEGHGRVPEDWQHILEGADHRGKPLTPWRLTGLLWNCTDTLPGEVCRDLDLPVGSTYAAAARAVRADLRRKAQ